MKILFFLFISVIAGFKSPPCFITKNKCVLYPKYGNSMNGFSFNEELKLSLPEKRVYDMQTKTRRLLELSKKKIEEEKQKNLNNTVKPGYPRQSNLNITYPDMDDIDDEGDEQFEKLLKKIANVNENVTREEIAKGFKKAMEREMDDAGIPQGIPEGIPIMPGGMPLGVRIFRRIPDDEQNQDSSKSENFEVILNPPFSFNDVGGYETVKEELMQTVDLLKNYEKYAKFNVRTPKGLILEGPPGNGKTLLAKAFSGEVNASFIPVSGSQFTEKYVGVGASRIRELFDLAKENKPTIIFIDEIDAVGRSRSGSEASNHGNSETQSTLNQLLVAMDGYNSTDGIFVIGATNRADLLDPALLRPGRIDKRVFIGNPDLKTREAILNIHLKGKPRSPMVTVDKLKDVTNGLSGAQIENLLNEGMLLALRNDRELLVMDDIETILARILVGYQSTENNYSPDMIRRIAIHEMGHAIVGILSLHHAKIVKVCLNLWSPSSPGYTIFENSETDTNIYTKEKLLSRLMVLLSGRIAEEVFFGASITSGASKDIEDAYGLAEQMIVKFGMGNKIIYPHHSEDSKNYIDKDIEELIETTYHNAHSIVLKSKELIDICANELVETQLLMPERIYQIMKEHGYDKE